MGKVKDGDFWEYLDKMGKDPKIRKALREFIKKTTS